MSEQHGVVSDRVLTLPNIISFARLLLVPVFAVLLLQGHDAAALVVLVVASASDWFDGVIARRLGQISRLGQMLDPAADRLFILASLLGLAWRGLLPWWVVVVLVLRDVVLGVLLVVLARRGYGPLPVHLAGKAGTFALLYAFPLLLLAGWQVESWLGPVAFALGWAATWWGIALYWFAGALYLVQARRLLSAPAHP